MSHLTVAVSEKTVNNIFKTIRDKIKDSTSGGADLGPFSLAWNIGFQLKGGDLDLRADNSVRISELDVLFDPLKLTVGLDLPEVCIGGFCLIPSPFGCILRVPKICVFSADPDIEIPIDISGLVQSEISGAFRVKRRYFADPARTPAMTDLDAKEAKVPNRWQFLLDPMWLYISPIDVADTVGNIFDEAINWAVDSLLGWLPSWAKLLIKAILGPIGDLIRTILDIGDDIGEWLSNVLGVSIGIVNFVATVVADQFANKYPIFEFEDPYRILDYKGLLIPVSIPVLNPAINVNDVELIVTAEVGT